MDRLQAFETMLREIAAQEALMREKMLALKQQGREKSATYRQYMGNRLLYQQILDLYRRYGLLE